MKVEPSALPEVKVLTPRRFADARGHFVETYNRRTYESAGIAESFVQDNESLSTRTGTVRGLHYQAPPAAQSKLVRVLRGSILDVVVDARRSSTAYGKWAAIEMKEDDGLVLYVPKGFLHGFVTRAPDTVVTYKVDALYDAARDGAVRWDSLGVDWGISPSAAVVSEKDLKAPAFADFKSPF
jgi:dTDP-4-dehydrorhamnose 3,5-epimerase